MFQSASSSSHEIFKQRYNLLLSIKDLWDNNIECSIAPLQTKKESKNSELLDEIVDTNSITGSNEFSENPENSDLSEDENENEIKNNEDQDQTEEDEKLTPNTSVNLKNTSYKLRSNGIDRPPSRRKPISTFKITHGQSG